MQRVGWSLGVLLLVSALVSMPAFAQRRGRPGRRTPPPAAAVADAAVPSGDAAVISFEVEPPATAMPDEETLVQLVQAAAAANNAEGAQAINLLLLRGVPPRIAADGLVALAVLRRPEGAPAVMRMLEHRRASLRRLAIGAAQAMGTPEFMRAIAARLSDGDADVRGDAAAALVEIGDASVVAQLFAAFERDAAAGTATEGSRLAHEAARGIARRGNAEDLTRLLGSLRRAPFRTMSDALRAAVARNELPEELRLRIVSAVADLATRDARECLNGMVTDARGADTAVVRAARAAAQRINAPQ